MNIHQKVLLSIPVISFFIVVTNFILPGEINAAYTSISFSPSVGSIDATETKITVMVDTGTDNFAAVRPVVLFTGSVQFVRSEKSPNAPCTPSVAIDGYPQGSLAFICITTSETGKPYKGGLVDLYFKATGSGTSTFSFRADPGDGIPITTIGTATFNLTGVTQQISNAQGSTPLPQTADGKNFKLIVVGIGLLLMGILLQPFCILANKIFTWKKTRRPKPLSID